VPLGAYGVFSDLATQSFAGNTPTPIRFNTTEESNGIYIGTTQSRIYVTQDGVYDFQFSLQWCTYLVVLSKSLFGLEKMV